MDVVHGYGKVENAFKPRYKPFHFEPFSVEILAFCFSMKEAADMHRALAPGKLQPVMHNETGVVYRNAQEAAAALGMHVSGIRNHLRGEAGFERPRGHTFQRVPSELYTG